MCIRDRGHSKEGRAALRIVGLALLVSSDFHIPLCHQTYPGNRPDSTTFAGLTAELIARHKKMCIRDRSQHVQDITLIFDKGNNSQANVQRIDGSPYHFIGSLVPTQHLDLLATANNQFHSLAKEGLPGVNAYRTTKNVFGKKRTIVVSYNQALFVAQSRTFLREIAKRQKQLGELQVSLERWHSGEVKGGRAPTMAGTKKKVEGWLAGHEMNGLFHAIVSQKAGLPVLEYRFDEEAWQQLQRTRLGKTILFTDRDTWSDAQIVKGYRSQHHVESAFRDLKNVHYLSLRPQRHWTDQKIQVHVFYCVLGLMLCGLLRRDLDGKGIKRSLPALLEELGQIQEICVVYPASKPKATPQVAITLTALSQQQQALYDALDLKRYRSP